MVKMWTLRLEAVWWPGAQSAGDNTLLLATLPNIPKQQQTVVTGSAKTSFQPGRVKFHVS